MNIQRLPIIALWTAILVLSATVVAQEVVEPEEAEASSGKVLSPKDLPEKYRAWLEEVTVLITEEEVAAFLALGKDYQRDAFIERFWRERDPYPDTGRNELLRRWEERVQLVRRAIRRFDDDRAKVLLLNGPPGYRNVIVCRAQFWPLEVWFYPAGSDRYRYPYFLIFYRRASQGPFRLWQLDYGYDELVSFDRSAGCQQEDTDALRAAMRWFNQQGTSAAYDLIEQVSTGPQPASREWVETFSSYSTDVPAEATTFPAELVLDFPGWHQNRTVLQGAVEIPVAEVEQADFAGHQSYNFALTGEILKGEKLFDSFRYRFDLRAEEIDSDTIPLLFQRYLRPGGPYSLVLRVEDLNSGRFHRSVQEMSIPRVTQNEMPPPSDPRLAQVLAEANAAIASGETSVKLVPPIGDLLTGLVRFDTLVTGREVSRVTFAMDGVPILTKRKPPFSVELDLGDFPRTQILRATAFDGEGNELANDEQLINVTGNRFRVRLVEPQRGKRYDRSLRVRAEVEVPRGDTLDRVEVYLNDDRQATLYQEPFVQPIVLPADETVLLVRVVAYRTDGSFTEDVVFVNAPNYSEDLKIQYVELFSTVLDRQKRPVPDMRREEFTVLEDGEEQEVLRFEQVSTLPIHAAILLDISSSMNKRLDTARQAALSFFEQTIEPKDRASIITFNDRPYLAVQFTNELPTFASGLAGLKAERGTALFDSVIYSLFYFTGIKGQRALLVLSDGKDEVSRFSFDEALEYTRRAGVTVYTIGLDLEKKDKEARRQLTRLAEETGGRSFLISGIEELESIYAMIQEELRSQYLITYQSTNTERDQRFRKVELKVERRGVEVKTMSGYYP